MDQRTRRSPARFLAPLGLIVVIVAFLAIVSSGGSGDSASTGTSSSSTSAAKTASTTTAAKAKAVAKKKSAVKRYYTIQTGDTLGAIATKTGIPLETIQSLNPDVDPHAMTTGQKIRLK